MFAALPPAPPAAVTVATIPSVAATDSHRVGPGDTVSGVAVRYGITRGELRRANDIGANNLIRVGEMLTIPKSGSATQSTGSVAARSSAPAAAARPGPISAGATAMELSDERVQARDAVAAAAREQGVDVDLALAVAWQESRWRPGVVSHAGARGVMQCMPVTGRWMSEKLGRDLDLTDLRDNATCGVMMLKTLQQSSDDETTVLSAYYQGMTSVKQNGAYPETLRYAYSVQSHRDQLAAGKALKG